MEAKLIVIRGKANKNEVALKLPSVIGRSREADLTIGHPMVSRRHCEVFETDGTLMIRDLGSLNGTLINGEKVSEAAVPANAEVTVGPLTFRVALPQEAPTGGANFDAFEDFAFEPAVEGQAAEAEETPVSDTADLTDMIDMPEEEASKPAAALDDDSFFMDEIEEAKAAAAPASPGEVTIDDEPEPTPPPAATIDEEATADDFTFDAQPPATEELVMEPEPTPAKAPAAKTSSLTAEGAAASGEETFIFEQDLFDDEPTVEPAAGIDETPAPVATAAVPLEEEVAEEAAEPAPAGEEPKKAKKGWFGFGGKDKKKDKKEEKAPAKPAAEKKPAPAPAIEPAAPAAAAPAKKNDDFDDVAFDMLQDDDSSGSGGDDGLDDFLKGLK
jgi:hypothetical protein